MPASARARARRPHPGRYTFWKAQRAEAGYQRHLSRIARAIDGLVRGGVDPENPSDVAEVEATLRDYADILTPWATAVARRMIAEVGARDRKAWREASEGLGRALHREIEQAPVGHVMQERLAEQVRLITSLPREAAERVREIATGNIYAGVRAEEMAREILKTGDVTLSRARLIARTETSRTVAELNRARAEHVGSTHFVWRTSRDAAVRPTHRVLEGKIFRWDDPPECDPGFHALPGAIFSCRCHAEPILPETI